MFCATVLSSVCTALDAGNSWMVLSEFTKFVLTCHQPLDDLQRHVMDKIGSGKEKELPDDMKKLFTAQWTSEVHNNFYMLHSQSSKMFPLKSIISSYRHKFNMANLSQEALSVYAKVIREIREKGVQSDTEMVVRHKLNACLPRSTLIRQTL